MSHGEGLPVSVVIPVYNGAATLGRALAACLGQDYSGPVEVIVVDDGSTDQTAEVTASFPTVRYLSQANAGPAAARTRGALAASGEVICFTDADCVPHPDWVSRLMSGFNQPAVAAVCGTYGLANPQSLLARCVQAEILFRHARMPDYPRVFGSYNVAIRRRIFFEIKGFDSRYRRASGEDNDLSYRILAAGHRIYFARAAVVDHVHPARVGRYLLEQCRHGFWRARMYRAHPRMARGDDYTFWKDSLEVATVFFLPLGGVLFLLGRPAPLAGAMALLVLINFYFSARMTRAFYPGVFFAAVMLVRSVARAAGLAGGLLAGLAGPRAA